MSEQSGFSSGQRERTELPIERGFPIERVNEIAGREGHGGARQWYRPIYAMHKWWARRLGSVFRSISLYALLDDPKEVEVIEPGNNSDLSDYSDGSRDVSDLIDNVDIKNPDSLWPLYNKDVRISNKKILDPFSGGGTSVVEASRFGVQSVGNDLNPVAWFVTKKELDAGQADLDELKEAFEFLENEVAEELQEYYQTPCPHCSNDAEAIYYFWVKELDCPSCGSDVPLFNDYRIANGRYEDEDGYYVYDPVGEEVIVVDDWKSECISPSGHTFNPKDGNVGRSKYSCPDCGQKYPITDAIQEQGGYRMNLYAVEYYCSHCDDQGIEKRKYKGYKSATEADLEMFSEAEDEWNTRSDLHEYVPSEELPPGHMTSERNPVFDHGVSEWTDMFNDRQLLTLAKLLKSIDEIDQSGFSQDTKEYLLLTFSDILRTNTMMTGYTPVNNVINQIFKTNSFDVPQEPVEGNPWGGKFGYATFQSSWDAVIRGVEWAKAPTERYVENGETKESPPFQKPVGENSEIRNGDVRLLEEEDEYDAVITDPPYYDNIIYSEVSDYFYVWQKILLEDEYDGFGDEKTPRAESIVANPFLDKGTEEFESELHEAFTSIHKALKQDGVLAFTYHHSNSESWGELLESLCDVGFEVTATYPITADINKFITGEAVSFDIVVVARPLNDTEAASWKSLRRDIYRTARRTRKQLEENRDLSRGDIGVMEMGACFREYSKHHGKVQRDGEIMSAKEVVQEIYGIIQEASDIGVEDVFIDLLDTANVSYDDVNKLSRGTNANPEDLKEMRLYNQDDGFELGTWDNEKRQAYIQERVNGDGDDHLSNLDKLQFLRYRYEKGQAVQNYVEKWDVNDDMRELAGRLADVTGDDTYTRVLGDRDITSY
ncbi:DUF1156 domain-containing protein [Haloarcula hispanica]|uniref:DUF1156 domain-containing protein n=1 Tax=Haloarcula hispanica TaxID=51589 RepID=A0A5J5LCS2_HALHI|nr:DUF1156 domain-containing protein [Haloarcula hispanica]KAA9404623.1 DUF1156 domain-containing protein [Haloarcula hispanica]